MTFENDGGLYTINAVPSFQCNSIIAPSIAIVNSGSNVLTSATIQFFIDSNNPDSIEWSGFLEPGAVDTIQIQPMTVSTGAHLFTVAIVKANGTADLNFGNNEGVVSFYIVGSSIPIPLSEKFESNVLPDGYFIENPDNGPTWRVYQQDGEFGANNYMMQMHFYYSYAGNIDEFYVRNIDLSTVDEALMSFDVAYRYYENSGGEYYDELKVMVSPDCGNNWDLLYDKAKDDLETLPPDDIEFFPSDPSQWRTEWIDLTNYAGNSNIIIRFQAESGHGNNLYVDNLNIASTTGTGDISNSPSRIKVFPNPANNNFTTVIQGTNSAHLTITIEDILGRIVYSTPVSSASAFSVKTADWLPGMYIINLADNGKLIGCEKLSVEH